MTTDGNQQRRALVVCGAPAPHVEEALTASGYETLRATVEGAVSEAERFSPDVLLLAAGAGEEARSQAASLVRRLRTLPGTFGLPLVVLFEEDEGGLRGAALAAGVDDYLPVATPAAELRARLDALFWRAEAGRRSAASALDQRAEIDNFLLLLDAVRGDAEEGRAGTLALLGAAHEGAGEERLMARAYGFFKLNLRRADAVAFYGPTLLFVYLPGRERRDAQATLVGLRAEFGEAGDEVISGIASFPEDGEEVEKLVEVAEARLIAVRAQVTDGGPALPAPAEEEAGGDAGLSEDTRAESGGGPPPRALPAHDEQRARESRMLEAMDASAASLAKAGAGVEAAPRTPAGPCRLLLAVSDFSRMARLNQLVRAAGCEVRAAFDGGRALNLLRVERPDLLLVDYELSDMNGLELLRRLASQQGGHLEQPSLLLVPKDSVGGARREALELGARAVVTTPYKPDELLASIREASAAG